MDKDYKNISKVRKDVADKILASSQIIQKLSEIGKVSVIGSYKYDLMFEPDIDIVVEAANPRASVIKALELIFQTKYF
ncbi:MAG: hypothetical protein WCJ58_08305 [bacterium]